MSPDPLDADFCSLADEALRLEPSDSISTLAKDYKTILIITATGLSTAARLRLGVALKAYRRRHDLVGEFLIVEAEGGEVPWGTEEMPSGWPPVGS